MAFVGFLSDYGTADEFVGVCKAVILGTAPDAVIVDLTHEVPAHTVPAGAMTLVRSVQYLPEGAIVLAVVDPGVGTDRRLVAVQCESATLVGPDNGLLAPAVAMLGGPEVVVEITRPELRLPSPGPTFAGRDILAPAVGYLAAGGSILDLGPVVDQHGLTPGLVNLPEVTESGAVRGQVWWIDRFGNCQLNVGPDDVEASHAGPGLPFELHFGEGNSMARAARWVHTYADARPSELVVLVDSYGLLSLALDRRSAAAELGLWAGAEVVLVPPGASYDPTAAPADQTRNGTP